MKNKLIFAQIFVILCLTSNLLSMGEKLAPDSQTLQNSNLETQEVQSNEKNTIKEDTLLVTGISCGSCSHSIKTNLKKLDGFISCDINIETGKTICTYDSSKLTISTIKSEIDKAGFTVTSTSK
ncbi:heavy-metal-associated domain-containing protein [bacterium]|jgi:copper chaperone CopZ|nr:heavy-metal-associated domain-containing protein [bacterium]